MAERRTLNFTTPDDVAADVIRLRDNGYQKVGTWDLAQTCFHLDKIMGSSMTNPAGESTPEQTARRKTLDKMLSSGKIPDGIEAPPSTVGPQHTPSTAIDDFLETLEAFKTFKGTFAPHRLFGNISADDRRRHQLIHCAHHLSYLVPLEPRPPII
jgi:hypothetical protein